MRSKLWKIDPQRFKILCVLCGLCGYSFSPRHTFAQHFVQQRFVDELGGVDRFFDFLRGAGSVNQELVAFDAIFAVWALSSSNNCL